MVSMLRICIAILMSLMFVAEASADDLPDLDPTWYVGNTKSGEWIEFQQVYLSEGTYRFTGHMGAVRPGSRVSIVLRDVVSRREIVLKPVELPTRPIQGQFDLVHMGRAAIPEGEYDIKLRFMSASTWVDFIYIRKSDAEGDRVLADDLANPAPPADDGTAITPIGMETTPSKIYTHPGYSEEQGLAWYKQAAHIGLDRDDSYRSAIETAITARLDWIWLHGRAAKTKPQWDWGYDREVVPNPGSLSSYRLKRYFEVLDETPFAEHLRYSYFCDNVFFGRFFEKNHDGKEARWEDPEFQAFIWENWIKAWYLNVPKHRHKLSEDGRIYLYFWTADCGVKGKQIYEFLVDVRQRLRDEFGLEVHFVLGGGFAKRGPRVAELTYAQPAWFYWNQKENVFFQEFNGRVLGFATNGRRLPIASIWEKDWDPKRGTGTRVNPDKNPVDGHLRSPHTNGVSDYETGLKEANRRKAEWIVLEAWNNLPENSTWFRSDHPEYKYPNEFINITRKFADRSTSAIMLQAECLDRYHDLTRGNDGKAYRYNWHTTGELDVDIFRPMHRVIGFELAPTERQMARLSVGAKDVWGIDTAGNLLANEKDGNARWKRGKSLNEKYDRVSVGRTHIWGIVNGDLYAAGMPTGWGYPNTNNWRQMTQGGRFREVSTNLTAGHVWALDQNGTLWRGEQNEKDQGKLKVVRSKRLTHLAASDQYIWGYTEGGHLVRRDVELVEPWAAQRCELEVAQLAAGSSEVWVLTKSGDVYRMPDHGFGQFEKVVSGVSSVSVGSEFVWIIKEDGKTYWSRLEGFVEPAAGDDGCADAGRD